MTNRTSGYAENRTYRIYETLKFPQYFSKFTACRFDRHIGHNGQKKFFKIVFGGVRFTLVCIPPWVG